MLITNVQRFTVRDGPGIRTTVFTKGCSLRCAWCHNPETLQTGLQVQYSVNRCVHCGQCAVVCQRFQETGGIKQNSANCIACGKCIDACPTKALSFSGKEMRVEEVVAVAAKDKVFFESSGGGVTISGGEPLLQPDLPQVLQALRKTGIHTAVDTALNVPWASVERALPHTSLFLVDIKAMDPEVHKRWTGCDNQLILENFRKLLQTAVDIWVRVPFIPGANDGEMAKIAEYLKETARERISLEVIPFHNYAANKYQSLGMTYSFEDETPPKEEVYQRCLRLFEGLNMITYQ